MSRAAPARYQQLVTDLCSTQDVRRALKALEQAVQSSPWLLSDNFVTSMVDKKGHLALVGPGDPTGKGRGFSFTKDPRRVSHELQAESHPSSASFETLLRGAAAPCRHLQQSACERFLICAADTR